MVGVTNNGMHGIQKAKGEVLLIINHSLGDAVSPSECNFNGHVSSSMKIVAMLFTIACAILALVSGVLSLFAPMSMDPVRSETATSDGYKKQIFLVFAVLAVQN
jgi:hypothetical protein